MMEEQINHEVTIILLKKIVELLDVKEEPLTSIEVNNLDGVKAHLRNELAPVIKSIKALPDNSDIVKALKTLSDKFDKIEFNPTINVAAADVTIPEIKVPEVSIPTITVPTPQVTVNAPEVLIPAPIVNVPAPIVNVESPIINFESDDILRALNDGLRKLRQNNMSNPVFVRMTDLERIIEALGGVQKATKEVMLGFPGAIRIQNATGGMADFTVPSNVGSGVKLITTAGTEENLSSSLSVKSVTIKALSTNTGMIYVGNSSVSSSNGFQLSAKDSVSLDISNLSTINLDSSVNGEGVSYMWSS